MHRVGKMGGQKGPPSQVKMKNCEHVQKLWHNPLNFVVHDMKYILTVCILLHFLLSSAL